MAKCNCQPQMQQITMNEQSTNNGLRLSQNPKTGGFRTLFLLENDFKTCSTINFPKKHPDFGGLETNRRHEIQT